MTYTKVHDPWQDLPDRSTPIVAAALDHIEDGIAAVDAQLPPGGVTGQALVKASDNDGDTEWGGIGSVLAADVQFTPAGGLSSTDVQSALAELDARSNSALGAVIGSGEVPVPLGVAGDLEVPFDCTITSSRLFADRTGSIVVNVWKDTYTNFPPTVAGKITASTPPTISSAAKSQDTTLSGWTTALAKGDVLRFNVDSVATIQRVTLSLAVRKTS
jgi:hypothetical protein